MKIRNGFVSNSSSSSFILGYAVIKNKNIEKFQEYCAESGIQIVNDIEETYANVRFVPCLHVDKKHRILSRTNHTELIIPMELEYRSNCHVAIIELGNDEGDSEFYSDSEYGDLDWDRAKNKSFWSGWQLALINLFDTDIIDKNNSQILFGAERNG